MHEFTLRDRDGRSHDYIVTPFGVEGLALVVEIRALALEPIGRVLGSMGALENVQAMLADKGLDANLGELFRLVLPAVPWAEVGRDVRSALLDAGGAALLRRILSRTRRDDRELSRDEVFGSAYARNWNEMFLAAWEVAKYNDLLGFTGTSETSTGGGTGATS